MLEIYFPDNYLVPRVSSYFMQHAPYILTSSKPYVTLDLFLLPGKNIWTMAYFLCKGGEIYVNVGQISQSSFKPGLKL